MEQHLLPIYQYENSGAGNSDISDDSNDDDSDDDDSDVEIASTVDEAENELIQLSTYLQLDPENDIDETFDWPAPPPSLIDLNSSTSDDEEENNSHQMILPTGSTNTVNLKQSMKRKRRQWSVKEKLYAIQLFEKNQSKHKTSNITGCTRAQLRNWILNKEDLSTIYKHKKGAKRKRVQGGGKKLVRIDLDHQLFVWYKSRRTNPEDTSIPVTNVRRERVTLRQLERQGEEISKVLNQDPPSKNWYFRFMKRNGLSLQRPKRQDKVPIEEVHRLACSFYTFNRRASLWAIKRGVMGAFTVEDICNMDESPLALFGDQATKSINYIGTSNEINGHISNKRFCTLLLTVFAQNQRMKPVVLFKGKGRIGIEERQQYSQDVEVIFTPKAVINTPSMNSYVQILLKKVSDGYPKLLITDSANSHLKPEIIKKLREKRVVVSIIPKGCTQYLQVLDTSIFSIFKKHYQNVADEYIDVYGPRSKIKLSAKNQRILCTRLISAAWIRTKNSFDFKRAFYDIGYIWFDQSPVSIRTLPGFIFDPLTVTDPIIDDNKETENSNDDTDVHILNVSTNSKMKQLSLDQFMKK